MDLTVRRIEATEGEALRAVRLAALQDAPFAFGSTFKSAAALDEEEWDTWAREGSGGDERATFLALRGDRVIGLVGGLRGRSGPGDVDLVAMWVAPEARRDGVGRLLVQAVLDWATATGAQRVNLWVTRGNDPAQRLYEAQGFAATGDPEPLPSDPCKDAIRMTLDLDTMPS